MAKHSHNTNPHTILHTARMGSDWLRIIVLNPTNAIMYSMTPRISGDKLRETEIIFHAFTDFEKSHHKLNSSAEARLRWMCPIASLLYTTFIGGGGISIDHQPTRTSWKLQGNSLAHDRTHPQIGPHSNSTWLSRKIPCYFFYRKRKLDISERVTPVEGWEN